MIEYIECSRSEYTCISGRGRSVVDYVIGNEV